MMGRMCMYIMALAFSGTTLLGCTDGVEPDTTRAVTAASRPDLLEVPVEGSLQNPAWSPDGNEVLFTSFRDGYNDGPADLLIFELESETVRTLVSDSSSNINLPGSSWNRATRQIVFSSDREPHDEIYVVDAEGSSGDEVRVTEREGQVAYEPSLSPDGLMVVFESHRMDVEGNGVITKYAMDGNAPYLALTSDEDDCRQPNWSPEGSRIIYQKIEDGQWNLWLMDDDGGHRRQLTYGKGDKTDASFSPDGEWVVYSYNGPETEEASLYIIPVTGGDAERITSGSGYHGAPSWAPDGSRIVYEYATGDPDDSSGTMIRVIETPKRFHG